MKGQFEKSDIFLFPSKIDSFGLVIIESLLSWTPVISYNLWEAQFLVKKWINGFAINNIEEYINSVKNTLKDEKLLGTLQNNSRKSVVSNYSIENFEKQLVKIIFEK